MSRPSFLNDNEGRAYPLVPGRTTLLAGPDPVRLPHAALVDFGCVLGPDAGYDELAHSIYLAAVARAGAVVTFDFASDAPGLAGRVLRFTRDLGDPEFSVEEAEVPAGDPSACAAVRDDPAWAGFLVTGDLAELAGLLPDGAAWVAGADRPAVEPALVQNLALGYVRTLNLANENRTRAEAAAGCPAAADDALGADDIWDLDDLHRTVVNRECLVGPLALRPGYNCTIGQSARDNSLTVSAALAAGAGQPCAEVPLTAAERPPTGSGLLTGGPDCAELVSSINGLTGGAVWLVPLRGTRVYPDPDRPNTLIVDLDLHDLTTCAPDVAPAG